MSYTPTYQFQLLRDELVMNSSSTMTNNGSGTSWTFSSGTWSVNTGASSKSLTYVHSGFFDEDDIFDFLIVVSSGSSSCRMNVYLSSGLSPRFGIFSIYLPAGTNSKYVRFQQRIRDTNFETIQIEVVDSSGLDVDIHNIEVKSLFTSVTTITPGNFKGLNYELSRSMTLHGVGAYITGSLILFGADWDLVRSIILVNVYERLGVRVTIDSFVFPIMLVDNISLNIQVHTEMYQGTLSLLKEDTWTNFVNNIDSNVNLSEVLDSNGYFTLDAVSTLERVGTSGLTSQAEITQRFHGTATASAAIQLADNQVMNIGFGDVVKINDSLNTHNGISSGFSLSCSRGRMRTVNGTVKVSFTSSHANLKVQAILATGGPWVDLTSGTIYTIAINNTLGGAYFNYYSVRVINSSGAANTITLTTGLSLLDVDCGVTFEEEEFLPPMFSPLHLLKAYIDRLVGVYDNADLSLFKDGVLVGSDIDTGFTLPGINPPSRFREVDYTNATLLGQYNSGKFWIGNSVDWTQAVGNINVSGLSIGVQTNLWAMRGVSYPDGEASVAKQRSAYFTYGDYLFGVIISSFTNIRVYLYGIIGHEVEQLYTQVVSGNISTTVTLSKCYEAVGIMAESTGAGGAITITDVTFAMDPFTPTGLALNRIGSGLATKVCLNDYFTPGFDPYFYLPITPPGAIIRSLIKIMAIGIDPVQSNDTIVFAFKEIDDLYENSTSSYVFNYEEASVSIDTEVIADIIRVGSPVSEMKPPIEQDAVGLSEYISRFTTIKNTVNWMSEIYLDSHSILLAEVGSSDSFLMNCYDLDLYRTDHGLTFVGPVVSPRQLNWAHTAGRILRRNAPALFNAQTNLMRLRSSTGDENAIVNFPSDGYGDISDVMQITSTGKRTPMLITFESPVSISDFMNTILIDKYKKFDIFGSSLSSIYLKSIIYNFATGKAVVTGWLI